MFAHYLASQLGTGELRAYYPHRQRRRKADSLRRKRKLERYSIVAENLCLLCVASSIHFSTSLTRARRAVWSRSMQLSAVREFIELLSSMASSTTFNGSIKSFAETQTKCRWIIRTFDSFTAFDLTQHTHTSLSSDKRYSSMRGFFPRGGLV